MWGEPRAGTEAHKVKQEADRRKRIAKDKGLDKLLSDAYHDSIKHYPAWIKNGRNSRWVYSAVTSAVNLREKNPADKKVNGVEFVLGDKTYKVTEKDGWFDFSRDGDNQYCDLELFLNDKKVFAIGESVHSDEWTTTYSPFGVNAYASDDWVEDFLKIKEQHELASKQSQIDFAEDPKRTQELKEAFGITELPDKVEEPKPYFNPQPSPVLAAKLGVQKSAPQKKSIFSKWWFWAIVIIILWIWLS